MNARKLALLFVILIPLCCVCAVGIYFLPPVHERLAWRVDEWVLQIKYALNPPQKQVFVPQGTALAGTQPADPPAVSTEAGVQPAAPTEAALLDLTATPQEPLFTPTQPGPTPTPGPTLPPTNTPASLPPQVELSGVRYEDQHGRWNYCAPANLSMMLTFWGWKGNRDVVGPAIKPDSKDKNVMPYEMAFYVNESTDLRAKVRVGGDLEIIKRFLASGYPVLVEKGTYLHDLTGVVSWMGHYQVVTGYDEAAQTFTTQDSFIEANHTVTYAEMIQGWRAFNYTYIIIYPAVKEEDVVSLLGVDADETTNYQNAAIKASNEVLGLQGIDRYFAWFNRGSNLVQLQDYANAAMAYDESFKIYPEIPEAERPWRMLWYQTGPYWAYFYSQRYYDVLYLADGTLNAMQSDKNLEESYYWRGMAKSALGDTAGAIADFRLALKYHPGLEVALYQLRLLGVENP